MTGKGLIIFAREPRPGNVKTRLAASIGDKAAAEIYQAMLLDTLEISRQLSEIETVVFWDCEEESLPRLGKQYGCRSRRQVAGNLGHRMQTAFAEMLDNGFEDCCIIGSDTPDLPPAYILEAFDVLATGQIDAVFGPSSDGGYYLLGLKHTIPQLFTKIDWSTPLVLRQSLAAAQTAGVTALLLPVWRDIDTQQDLNSFLRRSGKLSPTGTKTSILAAAL